MTAHPSPSPSDADADADDTGAVLARRDGRIGRLTLNRPQALNALDLPMIHRCTKALAAWRDDPAVHAVSIEGAGGRAFCAGGDIRAIRTHATAGNLGAVEAFFASEFALNYAIARYPKPFVALVDGMCMGGGIGVSVHGSVRIATEAAVFAMPETAIGYFPDIGATYVLPRLPGALGLYLGLTGARLQGADAVHAGLATHYVPRARLPELSQALAQDGPAAIAGFAAPLPADTLAAHRPAIDRCFAAPTVAAILRRLLDEPGEWAATTLATLRRMSPSAVLWSFEIIRQGAARTLAECLRAELALTRRVCQQADFLEGVRAMVVDKDRQPRWSAARLEDVDPGAIAALFA